MTLIRGYAETIRDISGEDADKRDRQLGVIIEETQRLGSILDDILNLSKLQSGTVEIKREEVYLNELVETVKVHFMSGQQKIEIRLDGFDKEACYINADYSKIQQVIYNLVGNAMSHAYENSIVTIAMIMENRKAPSDRKNWN